MLFWPSALKANPRLESKPVTKNRLGQETSPYLLQHKDNPVHWYPWGAEALDRHHHHGE